ncbi:MAG: OmpA family protein [Bernardetiaceae bacterium]
MYSIVWLLSVFLVLDRPLVQELFLEHQVDRSPLVGVSVEVRQVGEEGVARYLTDAEGKVALPLQTNKQYKLRLVHPDFFVDEQALRLAETTESKTFFLRPIQAGVLLRWRGIDFVLGKADLSPESRPACQRLARWLQDNAGLSVEIGCHTDARGADARNLSLSQQRAEILRDTLLAMGIAPERVRARGYGERYLLNQCEDGVRCGPLEHAQNQRIEILIVQNNPPK